MGGGGGKSRRASMRPECGKAEMHHFGKGGQRDFPWRAARRMPPAEDKLDCSSKSGGMCI